MTGFLRQQGQEISKSSLVQQLNIAKGNSASMSINCENGIYNMDPKQQEIKQVRFVKSRNKPIFQIGYGICTSSHFNLYILPIFRCSEL